MTAAGDGGYKKKLVELLKEFDLKGKSEIKVAAMYLLSFGKYPLEKFKAAFLVRE